MTPFEAYATYEALKLHFKTDNYDYFKYGGKCKVSENSYNGRNDKIFFQLLAKRYDNEEYTKLLVANFLSDNYTWPKELIGDSAKERYVDYQKKMQSLSYVFEQDMQTAFDSVDNPEDLLAVKSDMPKLLQLYKRGDITLESLIITDMILNFFPMWNRKITDTVVWPRIYRKILKYRPFLSIDVDKYKKILKEKVRT
jgi:hypothetical protein